MEVLLKHKSDSAVLPKPGDIVEGAVIEKRGSRLFVDLGSRGTGIVFGREYFEAQDIIKRLGSGERVVAKVVEPDNEEGFVELSLKQAGREKNWQEMKRVMESREFIKLKVSEANRGGLIAEYLGVLGFLPASQLSQEHYPRVEGGDKERIYEELKKLVGQELELTIIDVDPDEGKLIFSEKSRETEAIRQRLAQYHVGDEVDGEVAGLVSFGAFVKFGDGLEGLVHISEIDWQLISSPADVLKIGERVRAKIIGIEGDKVSLSLKALKEDPWASAGEKYKKGEVVAGTVVKFNPFGAFVKLNEDIQGLAHISEFGSEARMKEVLALGQAHEFKILSVDPKEHRLALGLIKGESPPTAIDALGGTPPAEASGEAPESPPSPA
ncbi:MAG: S1 RNA-binding domain-containing protein [Candidatus Sungbacteria bacterium]|uniref:S1 RNA-binding domain-containing protein n=1 Tax=Candidatus Sungiibacteriota bacterium TaxID=2750080 RepID=A0A932YYY3_9BACT|nr:S1 RNA-binding domain-containing protein [Candidatus Sungbacteria bacterium]